MLVSALRRGARRISSWSPEERDAVLYAASALFAGATTLVSSIPLYQQWGQLAVGPYVAGAVASAWLAHRRHRRMTAGIPATGDELVAGEPSDGMLPARAPDSAGSNGGSGHWTGARIGIFVLVLCGATLMPLSLEVLWQAGSGGTSHAQPEVLVVEQAGKRVLHGAGLYQQVGSKKAAVVPPGQPAADAFFPYLPGMAVFGLPSGTDAPARLTDARVVFSLITILVVIAALAMCRGPSGPRVLGLQVMTVLPTAALPLATGGDDLPVVALMLLGLVLLQRRRPLGAGLALGAAASLKFTAWPLAAICLLVVRDERGRRAPARLALGLGAVVLPAVLPVVLRNPLAFFDNVVRFPLGLTGIHSPAGSALPGHLIVSAFPSLHKPYTLAVAVVAGAVVLRALVRHTPRTPADAARFVGWVALAAIMLAPATRVGYLLYPLDLFAWAWMLRSEDDAAIAPGYSPLETAYISRENGVSTPGVAVGAREGSAAALAGTLGAVTGDDPPAVAGEAVLPVVAVAVPVPVRANVVGITVTARSQ